MVDNFSFTKGYKVDNYMYKPVELPYYLESFIYQCVDDALSAMRISKKSFFERNFKRGGMMPIKEMRRHPEWKDKYLDDAELKDIHMCKSCPNRSYSGCCPEYSAKNRKKIRMARLVHNNTGWFMVVQFNPLARWEYFNSEIDIIYYVYIEVDRESNIVDNIAASARRKDRLWAPNLMAFISTK